MFNKLERGLLPGVWYTGESITRDVWVRQIVVGSNHYLRSLEPCATDPRGFLGYQKRQRTRGGDLSYSELRKMFNIILFVIVEVTSPLSFQA